MIAFIEGILSSSIISFELHAAEETDLELCSYGQMSEVQMLRDLDLALGQGHISKNSAYTVCVGQSACPSM